MNRLAFLEQQMKIYEGFCDRLNEAIGDDNRPVYDEKYLADLKMYLGSLKNTDPESYENGIKFVMSRMGQPAPFDAETMAKKRLANAANNKPSEPIKTRDELNAEILAKNQADYDAIQKDEFERKNPDIIQIWVKDMHIDTSDESKSVAQLELTYKDGTTKDETFDIGTTKRAGGFANADKLYIDLKRMYGGLKPTELDIRLAMLHVAFGSTRNVIKWVYGPNKVPETQWKLTKLMKTSSKAAIAALAKKHRGPKSWADKGGKDVVYKNGNTTIYRTEDDEEQQDEADDVIEVDESIQLLCQE